MTAPLDPMDHRTGDERSTLLALLDDSRAEAVRAVEGLTDEQARRRLVPSLTTPLAILTHLAFVERNWFHHNLEGRSRADVGIPEDGADSWRPDDGLTLAEAVADYERACDEAREIVAQHDLDEVLTHRFMGGVSLRFVLLHVVRETSRHAGHADILREQLLAAGGRQEP